MSVASNMLSKAHRSHTTFFLDRGKQMFKPPTPLLAGELPVSPGAAFVYRAYDEDGDLLYVGLADHVMHRLGGHRDKRAEWLEFAVRIEWEMYGSREDAAWVERRTIIDEQPDFNVTHNQRRIAAHQFGHRRLYPAEAWATLGSAVREARTIAGLPQKAVAQLVGVDVELVRGLERGSFQGWGKESLRKLEPAVWWNAGSIEEVLCGRTASLMTQPQRIQRAVAAAHAFLESRGQ